MLNKKVILGFVYAFALFVACLMCFTFLMEAINILQLDDKAIEHLIFFFEYVDFYSFLVGAYWTGFALSFISVVLLIINLFIKNKVLKIVTLAVVGIAVIALIVFLSISLNFGLGVSYTWIGETKVYYEYIDSGVYTFAYGLKGEFVEMIGCLSIIFGINLYDTITTLRPKKIENIEEKKTE